MKFRRGKSEPASKATATDADSTADEPAAAAPKTARTLDDGPYDIGDVGKDPERLDLGSIQVPPGHEIELRLELEEATGQVIAVTAVDEQSAVQIVAFAAPRNRGIWAEIRDEIADSVTSSGGSAQIVDGSFGSELMVSQQGADAMRIVGVDGPRWMVRGVFNGAAAQGGDDAAHLEKVFRSLVIVRGSGAMPPREQLPLQLPPGAGRVAASVGDEQVDRPALTVPRRGPEITEIR